MPGLAEVYRRFGEEQAGGPSPLHGHVALALSGSDAALRALSAAPARTRRPAVVLAALHDLALAGRAPALAAAYAEADGGAAAQAAVDTLLRMPGEVAAVAARRPLRPEATGRGTLLHPAVTEAAGRWGATTVGLVSVAGSAGFDLDVDRVAITYGNGQARGEPSSPVQLTASVVGDRRLPEGAMPEVVARVGVGADLVDVTDADDARWLRACVAPDDRARAARLDAELALAVSAPRVLLRGEPAGLLVDAVARVPAGALPVVLTTWGLSRVPPGDRQGLLAQLRAAAVDRPVAWVSVEGVGVAPGVPTLGDRPASGHSIIGLTLLDGATLEAEALGRCWSRGRVLSWVAGG